MDPALHTTLLSRMSVFVSIYYHSFLDFTNIIRLKIHHADKIILSCQNMHYKSLTKLRWLLEAQLTNMMNTIPLYFTYPTLFLTMPQASIKKYSKPHLYFTL